MPHAEVKPPTLPSLRAVRTLTEREREILGLIGMCLSDDQIAASIHRSPRTVDFHLRSIGRKLGARSQKLGPRSRVMLAVTAVVYGVAMPATSPPPSSIARRPASPA